MRTLTTSEMERAVNIQIYKQNILSCGLAYMYLAGYFVNGNGNLTHCQCVLWSLIKKFN